MDFDGIVPAIGTKIDCGATGMTITDERKEAVNFSDPYYDATQAVLLPIDSEVKTEDDLKACKAIGGEGYCRVDFFKDRKTGKLYLNEINTIPGFTKYSMFPLLWEAAGVNYPQIVERIIELGYERYYAKNHREALL